MQKFRDYLLRQFQKGKPGLWEVLNQIIFAASDFSYAHKALSETPEQTALLYHKLEKRQAEVATLFGSLFYDHFEIEDCKDMELIGYFEQLRIHRWALLWDYRDAKTSGDALRDVHLLYKDLNMYYWTGLAKQIDDGRTTVEELLRQHDLRVVATTLAVLAHDELARRIYSDIDKETGQRDRAALVQLLGWMVFPVDLDPTGEVALGALERIVWSARKKVIAGAYGRKPVKDSRGRMFGELYDILMVELSEWQDRNAAHRMLEPKIISATIDGKDGEKRFIHAQTVLRKGLQGRLVKRLADRHNPPEEEGQGSLDAKVGDSDGPSLADAIPQKNALFPREDLKNPEEQVSGRQEVRKLLAMFYQRKPTEREVRRYWDTIALTPKPTAEDHAAAMGLSYSTYRRRREEIRENPPGL